MKPPAGYETWLDYYLATGVRRLTRVEPYVDVIAHARAELAEIREREDLLDALSVDAIRERNTTLADLASLRARLAEAEQLLKPLHAMCEWWVPEYCSTAAGFRARAALSAQEPRRE